MKPRGHPSLIDGETSTPVNVRLPATVYDRAYAKAREERVSVPDVIRRGLQKLLDDDDD